MYDNHILGRVQYTHRLWIQRTKLSSERSRYLAAMGYTIFESLSFKSYGWCLSHSELNDESRRLLWRHSLKGLTQSQTPRLQLAVRLSIIRHFNGSKTSKGWWQNLADVYVHAFDSFHKWVGYLQDDRAFNNVKMDGQRYSVIFVYVVQRYIRIRIEIQCHDLWRLLITTSIRFLIVDQVRVFDQVWEERRINHIHVWVAPSVLVLRNRRSRKQWRPWYTRTRPSVEILSTQRWYGMDAACRAVLAESQMKIPYYYHPQMCHDVLFARSRWTQSHVYMHHQSLLKIWRLRYCHTACPYLMCAQRIWPPSHEVYILCSRTRPLSRRVVAAWCAPNGCNSYALVQVQVLARMRPTTFLPQVFSFRNEGPSTNSYFLPRMWTAYRPEN
jgi:hypothetical protein